MTKTKSQTPNTVRRGFYFQDSDLHREANVLCNGATFCYQTRSQPTDERVGFNPYALRQLCAFAGISTAVVRGFPFPHILNGIGGAVLHQPNKPCRVRRWEDTGQRHGVLSPAYAVIDTDEDVFNVVERHASKEGLSTEVRYDNVNARLDSVRVPLTPADPFGRATNVVRAWLEVAQGCVGNRRLSVSLTLEILICSNGMGTKDHETLFEATHRGDVLDDLGGFLHRLDWSEVKAYAATEVKEFGRLHEIASSLTLTREEAEKRLTRLGLPKGVIPEGEEVSAWDISQNINDSSRFPWTSEERIDAGRNARRWLESLAA